MFWYDTIDEIVAAPVQKDVLAKMQKLTAYLRQQCQDYQLKLIAEDWSSNRTYRDLCQSYGWEAAGARFWLRKILHANADFALVYAQVIVPVNTYNAFSEVFKTLAAQSIGEVLLFQHQEMQRSAFKFTTLTTDSPLYTEVAKIFQLRKGKVINARASVFTLAKNYPLFVIEYFNPKFKITEASL